MTQNNKSMKMHDQNDALSDTSQALGPTFFHFFKLAVSIYQTNMSIAIELHSPFLKKMHKLFIIMKKTNLTVLYHIFIPGTVTEDAREQF